MRRPNERFMCPPLVCLQNPRNYSRSMEQAVYYTMNRATTHLPLTHRALNSERKSALSVSLRIISHGILPQFTFKSCFPNNCKRTRPVVSVPVHSPLLSAKAPPTPLSSHSTRIYTANFLQFSKPLLIKHHNLLPWPGRGEGETE